MKALQKQSFMIKFLVFLVMCGVAGFVLSVLLGIVVTPGNEEVPDWVFSVGFIGSFVLMLILFISNEHNGLQGLRAQAEACRSDRSAILLRTDNLLLELNVLLENQLKHEENIFLNMGKSTTKETVKKVGSMRTMEEIKHNIREYPVLGSNDQFMRLFSQTARCQEELLAKTMIYNKLAADYNAGIFSFPAKCFRKMWKFEPMDYFEQEIK